MKRIIRPTAVVCILVACVIAVCFIRTHRINEQLGEAILAPSDLGTRQQGEAPAVAEMEVPFPDLQAAAETLELDELDEAISQKLQRLKAEEEAKQADEPFVQRDRETILDHQLSQRRTAWYREGWLGSFQKYASKDAAWASLAEEFLEKTAAGRQYGQSIPLQTRIDLRPLAMKLLELGCDDPVVSADLLCVLDGESPEHQQLREQLFQRFLDSDYPAHIALWTGCPHIGAERLLHIQNARRAAGRRDTPSPFDVPDRVDQRIVLELFIARHRLQMLVNPLNKNPLWALGMNKSSPWLKKMILAYYTFSGTVDQSVMMAMAGERVDPLSQDFARIWNTLRSDPGFGETLANNRIKFARNLLLSAWHEVPENPEATTLILEMVTQDIQLGQNRVRLDVSGPEWFREAIRAQLDYVPAYHALQAWLGAMGFSYPEHVRPAAARLAGECLDSGRFDTIVPALYLKFMDLAAQSLTYSASGPVIHMDKNPTYALPQVRQAIERLVTGYEKNQPHGVDLNSIKSHLVCAAFAAKDFDAALAQLKQLGDSYDSTVFQSFGFSPQALRRGVARRAAHLPFDLGSGVSVQYLAFARGGNALISLGSDGGITEFGLTDGTVTNKSEHAFQNLAVPMSGSQFVAQEEDNTVIRSLDAFESARMVEAGQFVPLNVVSDAQKYWATADQDGGSHQLTLSLRNFNDGKADVSLPTSFVEIHSLAVASQTPILAMHGLAPDADTSQILPHIAVWNLESNQRLLYQRPDGVSVSGLSLSPDGKTVALRGVDETAGQQGRTVYLVAALDMASGETLWKSQSLNQIHCLQFLADGRRFLTAGNDRIVRVWSRDSGVQQAVLVGHNEAIIAMTYSESLGLVATGDSDGRVRTWEVKENRLRSREPVSLGTLQFPFVHRLAVDPTSGDILTSSEPEGTIRWRKDAGYQAGATGPYGFVDWTADGRMLLLTSRQLSADNDAASPKIFSLGLQGPAAEGCVPMITIESPRYAWGRIFPDGKSLLTTGDVATVWNLESGEPRRWGLLLGHASPVMSVDISADGRRIATLTHRPQYHSGFRAEVRVWEVPDAPDRTGVAAIPLFHHEGTMMAADLSADGKLVLLVDNDGRKVDIRDIASGRSLGTLSGIEALFSPLSDQIAVVDGGSEVVIYELPSLEVTRRLSVDGSGPHSLCWGPDGRTLCFVIAGSVHCMDIASGQELVPNTNF